MAVPFYIEEDEFEGNLLAGKYLVARKIGRGGMGAVYQATHVLMDRVVAIKVVRAKHANADPVCLHRFRLEAKATSCLNHPNIMTVYDFGITDDGVAYLVMDYIEGEGLDVVLKREGHLSPLRAVSIFSQACAALAHAHDRGVIHRDLKPSNVMLTRDENGNEAVKIVDFGIARMLPGRARSAENVNDGGQVIGSPIYMSPEQCMGDEQDGRSDVYSLGCLLYEALSGVAPMADKHVLGIMYKHLNEPARSFSITAPERKIPSSIEAVVLKALAKNPNDRHQTMRDFARELKRALEIQQDHYEIYSQLPASDNDPYEQHYLRQLNSAFEQYGTSAPDTVPYMLQLADYYVSRNCSSKAEPLIRNAVEILVSAYGAWDSRVAAAVLRLAELYRTENRMLDAEPLYMDLLAIKRSSLGKNHPDIPFVMLRLAELYFATGRYEPSYKMYQQCLRIAESVYGQEDPVLTAIIIGMATVLMQSDRLDEAVWLYQRALELNEYHLGPYHQSVVGPLVALGVVYRKLGKLEEAERVLYRAIEVSRRYNQAETNETVHALWLLAEIYGQRGANQDAEKLYEYGLHFFETAHGDDDFVAQLYNNYGVHFVRTAQMERAETQFIKALKIRERVYGKKSEQVASSLNLIATLYHSQSKLALAEVYYQRSLEACAGLPSTRDLADENIRALQEIQGVEAEPETIEEPEANQFCHDEQRGRQIMGSLLNLYKAANEASGPAEMEHQANEKP